MSDDEMDRAWTPNRRPQSTMARSFSAALDDMFKIDNSLADLDAAVDRKKKAVNSQTSELHALEARIKATEERLQQRQSMSANLAFARGASSPRQRVPIGDTFGARPIEDRNAENKPASPSNVETRPKTPTRPATGRKPVPSYNGSSMPPIPGGLPPTPGHSEGDYAYGQVSTRSSADYVVIGKDGDSPTQEH